jgi:hypothetical protein
MKGRGTQAHLSKVLVQMEQRGRGQNGRGCGCFIKVGIIRVCPHAAENDLVEGMRMDEEEERPYLGRGSQQKARERGWP